MDLARTATRGCGILAMDAAANWTQHHAMTRILQTRLSFAPWADPRTRRLPGIVPVATEDWLEVDSAFGAQMALREQLLDDRPEDVVAVHDSAVPAATELYNMVLGQLPGLGYGVGRGKVTRPDGIEVPLDTEAPLAMLGRLVQCDLCLMQPDPNPDPGARSQESVLTGAVLCFPAGWQLAQKFMRPMVRIHRPVDVYSDQLAKRVQRLLDGVQVGRGLMRGTAHYSDAPLHDARAEAQHSPTPHSQNFIRVERQCLIRLPVSRAVVFSIHTQVVRTEALSPHQAQTLAEFPMRMGN